MRLGESCLRLGANEVLPEYPEGLDVRVRGSASSEKLARTRYYLQNDSETLAGTRMELRRVVLSSY